MKAKLLAFLACPNCKGPLQHEIHQSDPTLAWLEIVEGSLTCRHCGHVYPISNGVPRLIVGQQPAEVQNTVKGFGWEWLRFDRKIQHTYMTHKAHFLDFIHPITEDFFAGKLVLDAGCGMGRFLKLGAEFGSLEIIGMDLSQSVEAAYRNTRDLPNAHVVQADIMAPPFVHKFDYIFSVGVLHHLPDPKEGFSRLADLLGPSGKISAWVYARENNEWVISFLSPLRKHLTSHLPTPVLLGLSQFLGIILYALLKLVYKPVNEHKTALRLERFLPYNDYLYYNTRLSYTSLVSVIFDHLVPQLSHYISLSQFENWFRDENLTDVMITSRNNMSWRGLGTRTLRAEEAA